MAKSLGERIKNLRKELQMTQTELAGGEMTKSMLSQIENNLATPSMKNLQYIAARLGRPAAYFLGEGSYESTLPTAEIYEELKGISRLLQKSNAHEALPRLEEMHSKYSFDPDSKLYADFLSKYGECLIDLNKTLQDKDNHQGIEKIQEAVEIYKSKFLYVEAARAYLNLIGIHWKSFEYQRCLDTLEEAQEIYEQSINKDYAFEMELLYLQSLLKEGLDSPEESILAAEEALAISRETHIYYKSDELYKTLALMNALRGNMEHFEEYIEKGRQFSIFTDNTTVLASIDFICGLIYNQMEDNPQKALPYLDKCISLSEELKGFGYTEKAKAYYNMGQYQQALEAIDHVVYPNYTPFKYDYLHIWGSKIYQGLSLHKLGHSQEALTAIRLGIEKMEAISVSQSLAFAYQSLSEVYSAIEDFENAFAALKKANSLKEEALKRNLYY